MTFEYTYSGNQQFSNNLKIYNATTNALVYNQTQTTFKLEHILPANSLNNGVSYNAELIVYDSIGTASPASDKIFFKCFTTPSFSITNIVQSQIIRNSNYALELAYTQTEGELLNEYNVVLYNSLHQVVSTSSILYPLNGMSYSITGLLDNQQYYVQAFGTTVNGMSIEATIVEFYVEYINPTQFSLVDLTNLPYQGAIKIQSNIIPIDGTSNPEPPIYINGKKVDLSAPSHWVKYNKGFKIDSDFLIKIVCNNITRNSDFFVLTDGTEKNQIILKRWQGFFDGYNREKTYIVLNVITNDIIYRQTSELIDILAEDETVSIVIKKVNNLYLVHLERV